MLEVFFTVDVEVWCYGWSQLDAQFPGAFRRYVYGETRSGNFGLPFQLEALNDHGLRGVFFVEPLFSTRFGKPSLDEIVGLIKETGQEVQLHLHTEWVDESRIPILQGVTEKRQHLKYFSLADQTILIGVGVELLRNSGSGDIAAFRAGGFECNVDTLRALACNRIRIDSSYNASMGGASTGILPSTCVTSPVCVEGVYEYPMTVFRDGFGKLRHTQVTACSFSELEHLLWQALEQERGQFVILFHNFELLNRRGDRPDNVVVARFKKLCEFLDRNRDVFVTRGFSGINPCSVDMQPDPLQGSLWRSGARVAQQAFRRFYS